MSIPIDEFCTQALELAQTKSLEVENGFVGTEHLLWGMLEAHGELFNILKERNTDIDGILKSLEPLMTDYSGLSREKGPKTPRLRKILMDAQQLALQLMEPRIDEKIMARALFSAGKGGAVRTLESMGLNCNELLEDLESRQKKLLKEKVSWLIQENKPLVGQPIPRQFFPLQGQIIPPVQGAPADAQPPPMRPTEAPVQEKAGSFGRDLLPMALSGKIGPILGRAAQISEISLCLRRATSNNPVLVGEKGVGKTSVVEGLAIQIAQGEIPEHLKMVKIVEISGSKFFQLMGASKESEERFKTLVLKSPWPGTILFLDGVLDLLNEERLPWAVVNGINLIREKVEDGVIRIIVATNPKVYEKRILQDPVFSKHCQKILIEELAQSDAVQALRALTPRFEEHHGVKLPDDLISTAAEMAMEYIKDSYLPGKALDLIDEACAIAGSRREQGPDNQVTESDLMKATSKRSGLPLEKISRKAEKFKNMEEEIHKRIIGQDEAVRSVCNRIKLFMTGLQEENRPLGVLFFAGPTGVGKTELSRVVSSYLFGSETHFHRFDMSEYSQPHEVSRLVGAPPGYVGFEEEGQLTGKVKNDPYCVILLDEVEKAHPRVFDTFLQVFDAGRLTDGKGTTVDFRNTLIIMTSNIGSDLWATDRTLGFRQKDGHRIRSDRKEKMTAYLKDKFSPEFVNRINEVVLFNALTEEDIRAITLLILNDWKEKTRRHGVELHYEENLIAHLSKEGYSSEFGVRNLRRTIENIMIVPLSRKILEGEFSGNQKIWVRYSGNEVVFEPE